MLLGTFTFNANQLQTGITELPAKLDRLMLGVTERQVDISEGYMREHAPWTDRTGNARNGLHAVASHAPGEHTIVLAHAVPYGIWLEVKFGGRDAIIYQSVVTGGQDVMRLLNKGMARL